MRITYLTAGAGGMICGSCLHDNALASALRRNGHEIVLVPIYTPIRTDEPDSSSDRVFLGGITMYLRQSAWFRWLPRFTTRWLDRPGVIRFFAGRSIETDAGKLGAMAVSILKGEAGPQSADFRDLHAWMAEEAHPEAIVLSNLLIAGGVPELKARTNAPIVVVLQGDDLFLDGLADSYRAEVLGHLRRIAPAVDQFVTHSRFYAAKMGPRLGIPADRIALIPLGIQLQGEFSAVPEIATRRGGDQPFTVGYLARMAPEKGLEDLCRAYVRFREKRDVPSRQCRLLVAGWMGARYRSFVDHCRALVAQAGFGEELEIRGELTRQEKAEFLLNEIDALCVPSPYEEPKGLYALEAMACGVPIISPRHGVFPELIEESGGGLLFTPGNIDGIVDCLAELADDSGLRKRLAESGLRYVRDNRTIESTAVALTTILDRLRGKSTSLASGG